jgi:lambda repressor-like predicted transcriptional regulator
MPRHNLETHAFVKECLRRRGRSFAQLARTAGVSTSSIYSVSKGFARSARLEAIISEAAGFKQSEIWPEREKSQVVQQQG